MNDRAFNAEAAVGPGDVPLEIAVDGEQAAVPAKAAQGFGPDVDALTGEIRDRGPDGGAGRDVHPVVVRQERGIGEPQEDRIRHAGPGGC